jgi:hypothetical protein
MVAPCCDPWLYETERLIENGLITKTELPRNVQGPVALKLYNIVEAPMVTAKLTDKHPDVAQRLLHDLETWFDEDEQERVTIHDQW